ncbi:MAG: hypothetical protein WCJ49_09395, partial [Deltaproteobacteria bacterium]
MIPNNSHIYIETSGLNYLANAFSLEDAKATMAYHVSKGTKFYLSPATIWELLLTSDDRKREKLIFFAQNFCYDKLLNSPSELIINYILAGCPLRENKYDFHSRLEIAKTWTDLSRNHLKTFVFNSDLLKEKTKFVQTEFKSISKQIEDVTNPNNVAFDDLIRVDKEYDILSDREKQRRKLALLLIFFILCSEIDFDSTPIKEFWNKIGMSSTFDRMVYVMNNLYELVHTGPFAVMSEMGLLQLEQRQPSNRGVFLD